MTKHIFSIVFVFCLFFSNVVYFEASAGNDLRGEKQEEVKDGTKDDGKKKEIQQQAESKEKTFERSKHPCDSQLGEGNAILGFLQYNLDCAPWYNDKILDLQGGSKWSLVSWFVRLISVFYRLAFVMTVVAIFVAGLKYIKAGGQGGFEVAKDALKFALIGFVVTSTSWAIINMLMRAMTMLSGGSLFVQTYFLKDTLVGCFVIFLQMEGKIVSHK